MSEGSSTVRSNFNLVSSRQILDKVRSEKHAVAALNFYNAETLRGHIEAARALHAPLILQTTESTINYLGIGMAAAMANAAAAELDQPVALHLDHGASYELAARCVAAGYTSVMIDGSKLSFRENCELTKKVVMMAHQAGVTVEGELGHVSHNDLEVGEISQFYTDPETARLFVEETQVDALAVAVGTAHGFYRGEVRLDFQRLLEIHDAVPETALVLHGGSGISAELLERAIECGISKINFGTEIKNAFTIALKRVLASSDEIDLRKTFLPAIAAVEDISTEKIRICTKGTTSSSDSFNSTPAN